MNDTCLGRAVTSKAGRDKGRTFLIVGIADDNHVLLADGETSWTFDLKAGAETVVSVAVTVNDIDAYNAVVNNTAYVNDVATNTVENTAQRGSVPVS